VYWEGKDGPLLRRSSLARVSRLGENSGGSWPAPKQVRFRSKKKKKISLKKKGGDRESAGGKGHGESSERGAEVSRDQ